MLTNFHIRGSKNRKMFSTRKKHFDWHRLATEHQKDRNFSLSFEQNNFRRKCFSGKCFWNMSCMKLLMVDDVWSIDLKFSSLLWISVTSKIQNRFRLTAENRQKENFDVVAVQKKFRQSFPSSGMEALKRPKSFIQYQFNRIISRTAAPQWFAMSFGVLLAGASDLSS